MAALHVLYEDATLRVAEHDAMFLAVWTNAPSAAQMRELGEQSRAFQARKGPRTAMWDAIVAGTPAFSAEVRDAAAQLTSDDSLFPCGTAHVVTLGGLRGSATRAFLATATLLGRPRNPTRVFGAPEPAAAWLAAALDWPPERILALHAALCEGRE